MRRHGYEKVEELTPGIQTYRVRNAVVELLGALVQHTGEFEHGAGLRVPKCEPHAMTRAGGIVPEDLSISSVRAMIAASGGATFTMVIHRRTQNSTLALTFCTLRWYAR